MDLFLTHKFVLILTLMVTSKGIAGVPGVSFVVLLATLGSVGIPLEGLAFIAGVDRILDMARTALNVVGNSLAALVIAKWEGQYDRSEEHTSELQSLMRISYAVFCLKKKIKKNRQTHHDTT